jgi:hypothetical protein
MLLLPPRPGACPICAREHAPEMPHDALSIYYQYRFFGSRGRWPTWADALAHCDEKMRSFWESELRRSGYWSEPADGDPIADPPEESFHQAVGDVNQPGFGPE